jgi:uncharacterized phage protein (TIGR02218 family)
MSYISNEESNYSADLRELYTFELTTGTVYLTSHDEDVVYGGTTYVATENLSRGNVMLTPLTRQRELSVTLPISNAVALSLIPIPPRTAMLSIVRIYADSLDIEADRRQHWYGAIAGVQVEGDNAILRVPNALDIAFDVRLPILRVSRSCLHPLYSTGCGITRLITLRKSTTVASLTDSNTIVCTSLAGWADQYARHGDVERVSDGERRSILDHVGNTIVIDVPFPTLAPGDSIRVWAGCDKQPATCSSKFGNLSNFGGHPHVPIVNPASPTGRGLL